MRRETVELIKSEELIFSGEKERSRDILAKQFLIVENQSFKMFHVKHFGLGMIRLHYGKCGKITSIVFDSHTLEAV